MLTQSVGIIANICWSTDQGFVNCLSVLNKLRKKVFRGTYCGNLADVEYLNKFTTDFNKQGLKL